MKSIVAASALLALLGTAAAYAESMQISPNGSRPSAKGPAANFTGTAIVNPFFGANQHTSSNGSMVTFEPGARSAWHTHPGGQILIVMSGMGWIQEEGGPKREIKPSDVIWTPPGVKHWPAVEISKKGHNAFVLKYRAGFGQAIATQDLAAAISFVFRNAEALGVSRDTYSLWGSSAGARMVAAIGTSGIAAFGWDDLPRPAAVVMAYTGHSDHSSADPPTFAIVGESDGISPPAKMERRVTALRQAGVQVEYRKYSNLGHGFGLGSGTSAEGWILDATRFWERFMSRRR